LNREVALYFRDQLRDARAAALRDAEAFEQLVFVVERIGVYLTGKIENFSRYSGPIAEEARRSLLAEAIPTQLPNWHAPFTTLYDLVRQARNDALHEGAFARHLTTHAVELTIILEDALMSDSFDARDFMVGNPICAFRWQPISSIRRSMLANSFTYLPLAPDSTTASRWSLVSDFSLAFFLRAADSGTERNKRLACKLGDAVEAGEIALLDAPVCGPEDSIATILGRSNGKPVLVVDHDDKLRGIVTPFDLL
jgi:CBS domain-containing protein